ncbi:hypothetical protein [Mucilaginibacter paludis]|uniref:Uncharacterized protein n=1 Tax=Mucilaginibacter paludis DSM 18603 TaxID=714943 RepID=H1Y6K5_9SPHI|nr:hypothetical protein [Mucilaginibacter paludis]EHQ25849.1 hypothetical protein Mucpa_1694 [Mucilaginibacter paludis DSM 18603]
MSKKEDPNKKIWIKRFLPDRNPDHIQISLSGYNSIVENEKQLKENNQPIQLKFEKSPWYYSLYKAIPAYINSWFFKLIIAALVSAFFTLVIKYYFP